MRPPSRCPSEREPTIGTDDLNPADPTDAIPVNGRRSPPPRRPDAAICLEGFARVRLDDGVKLRRGSVGLGSEPPELLGLTSWLSGASAGRPQNTVINPLVFGGRP